MNIDWKQTGISILRWLVVGISLSFLLLWLFSRLPAQLEYILWSSLILLVLWRLRQQNQQKFLVILSRTLAFLMLVTIPLLFAGIVGRWIYGSSFVSFTNSTFVDTLNVTASIIVLILFNQLRSFESYQIHLETQGCLPWALSRLGMITIEPNQGSTLLNNHQVELEVEPIPVEERRKCPNCEAVISQTAHKCSWCGVFLPTKRSGDG